MIELRHLKSLAAIRDGGSLVEAAERLHVTQSALSHQLRDLEDRLGLSLLNRKARPLRFTPAGQRLLDLADELLPRVRGVERELRRMAAGASGRLHLAIECHSCFQWLMPALDAFREQWPDVALDLSAGFSFAPLPALVRGDLDMVITSDPVADDALCYVPLFRYELVMALANDHVLTRGRAIRAADLASETLLAYPVDRDRLDIFTAFLDPAGVEPALVRTTELTPLMVQLVASGRGLAALPNWALTEYLQAGLVTSRPLGGGVWRTLYAAVRRGEEETPYIEQFMEIAREHCFRNLEGIREVKASDAGRA